MLKTSFRYGVIASMLVMSAHAAGAHGIAGNRFFVGTLTFDDPAVADEAVVPNFSSLDHPTEGGKAVDDRIDWAFVRLLTPTLEVSIDSAGFTQLALSASIGGRYNGHCNQR